MDRLLPPVRHLGLVAGLASLCACHPGGNSQLNQDGSASQLFLALASAPAADGTTTLYGASPLPLTSLSFCVGAGGDCDQPGATVIPGTALTLPNGTPVFASSSGVALTDGLAVGIKAVTSADSSVLRLALRLAKPTVTAVTEPAGDLDPQSLSALALQAGGGINGLLAALPDAYDKNLALVYSSHSRQQATQALPRQILYGYDARFLLAVGSVPGDPVAGEVEFAAFNQATGLYQYGTLTYPGDGSSGTPTLNMDSTICQNCHGNPTRPIWGQYDAWTGVYGSDCNQTSAGDQQAFAAFLAAQPSNPRYSSLKFGSTKDGLFYYLLDRKYDCVNLSLNTALASNIVGGTFTRMQATPAYASLKDLVLANSDALGCRGTPSGSTLDQRLNTLYANALANDPQMQSRYGSDTSTASPSVKAYRLLGIDPGPELTLAQLAKPAPPVARGLWYIGGPALDSLIATQSAVALSADDPAVQQAFGDRLSVAQQIVAKMQLSGSDRGQQLKDDSEYDWYDTAKVFSPTDTSWIAPLCQHLVSQLPGS